MENPTVEDVIHAMKTCALTRPNGRIYGMYIAMEVRGNKRFSNCRTDLVTKRLKDAEKAGLVARSKYTTGYYGYSWRLL